MAYELGGTYKIKLIDEDEDDDKYKDHNSKILFKNQILKDGEEVKFKIISKKYTVTENVNGEIKKSKIQYNIHPNHFQGSILYFPSFELINEKTDLIKVDCSSHMCREPHFVKCQIIRIESIESIESISGDMTSDE